MTDSEKDTCSGTACLAEGTHRAVAEKPQSEEKDSIWKERILVVDDEERVCQTLEEFLTLRGYLVDIASGGPEAMKMMEEKVYALMLTDLMMPRMNGMELMEQAKDLDSDLMVVIITGFGTIETAVQALKHGAYDYVLKPFSLMEIERTVERALEKRRLTHENLQLIELNRRLREIDSLKSDLLGIVSHEFRTPLTSIKGYVSLMLGGGLGEVSEPQREALDAVEENTRRLEKLVDNILILAEVGSGTADLRIQEVDVGAVLEEGLRACAMDIKANDIEVSTFVEPDLPVVQGDSEKLAVVVGNTIDNAVKFRSERATISVRAVARSYKGDGWVDLVITDNGIGIGEQDLNNIFGNFFQADMTATRRIGGVGLGLCVVREVIRCHGGTIRVHSKLGEGTEVTISLRTHTIQ